MSLRSSDVKLLTSLNKVILKNKRFFINLEVMDAKEFIKSGMVSPKSTKA